MILIRQRYRQTDRQTDGQHAISIPRYALVHRAVKIIYKKHANAKKPQTQSVNETHQLHIWNNSNVSKINYQHIARRPPVCAVYIMVLKLGSLTSDQNGSEVKPFKQKLKLSQSCGVYKRFSLSLTVTT